MDNYKFNTLEELSARLKEVENGVLDGGELGLYLYDKIYEILEEGLTIDNVLKAGEYLLLGASPEALAGFKPGEGINRENYEKIAFDKVSTGLELTDIDRIVDGIYILRFFRLTKEKIKKLVEENITPDDYKKLWETSFPAAEEVFYLLENKGLLTMEDINEIFNDEDLFYYGD